MKSSKALSRRRGQSVLDLLFVLLGKAATLGAVFIGGVVAARFGGISVYGSFVAGIALALLLDGVLGTAFDLEVVRSATKDGVSDSEKVETQRSAFHLKWISIAVLTSGFIVLDGLYQFETGSLPVLPALVAALGVLLARSVAVALQIDERFGLYSKVDGAQSILRLAGFALVALLGVVTAGTLLYAYAIVGLLIVFWGCLKQGLGPVVLRFPRNASATRFFGSMSGMFFIIACGAATGRGDVLALSFFTDERTLAPYGVASQLTQLLSQLALYASVVTQPRIQGEWSRGRLGRLAAANAAAFLALSLVCWMAWYLGLVEWGIELVFGAEFLGALPLLEILALGGLLDVLIVPVFMTLAILVDRRSAVWGEVAIALLFVAATVLVLTRCPLDIQLASMAWVFVGTRAAKLMLYGWIFLRLSRSCRLPLDRGDL